MSALEQPKHLLLGCEGGRVERLHGPQVDTHEYLGVAQGLVRASCFEAKRLGQGLGLVGRHPREGGSGEVAQAVERTLDRPSGLGL